MTAPTAMQSLNGITAGVAYWDTVYHGYPLRLPMQPRLTVKIQFDKFQLRGASGVALVVDFTAEDNPRKQRTRTDHYWITAQDVRDCSKVDKGLYLGWGQHEITEDWRWHPRSDNEWWCMTPTARGTSTFEPHNGGPFAARGQPITGIFTMHPYGERLCAREAAQATITVRVYRVYGLDHLRLLDHNVLTNGSVEVDNIPDWKLLGRNQVTADGLRNKVTEDNLSAKRTKQWFDHLGVEESRAVVLTFKPLGQELDDDSSNLSDGTHDIGGDNHPENDNQPENDDHPESADQSENDDQSEDDDQSVYEEPTRGRKRKHDGNNDSTRKRPTQRHEDPGPSKSKLAWLEDQDRDDEETLPVKCERCRWPLVNCQCDFSGSARNAASAATPAVLGEEEDLYTSSRHASAVRRQHDEQMNRPDTVVPEASDSDVKVAYEDSVSEHDTNTAQTQRAGALLSPTGSRTEVDSELEDSEDEEDARKQLEELRRKLRAYEERKRAARQG
ncbi:hypothetical protein LTR27_008335 [Elasticomyces elasticus]|nr:hypothetical protein LTR27_008335 [Elasticomyces elasticus]